MITTFLYTTDNLIDSRSESIADKALSKVDEYFKKKSLENREKKRIPDKRHSKK